MDPLATLHSPAKPFGSMNWPKSSPMSNPATVTKEVHKPYPAKEHKVKGYKNSLVCEVKPPVAAAPIVVGFEPNMDMENFEFERDALNRYLTAEPGPRPRYMPMGPGVAVKSALAELGRQKELSALAERENLLFKEGYSQEEINAMTSDVRERINRKYAPERALSEVDRMLAADRAALIGGIGAEINPNIAAVQAAVLAEGGGIRGELGGVRGELGGLGVQLAGHGANLQQIRQNALELARLEAIEANTAASRADLRAAIDAVAELYSRQGGNRGGGRRGGGGGGAPAAGGAAMGGGGAQQQSMLRYLRGEE